MAATQPTVLAPRLATRRAAIVVAAAAALAATTVGVAAPVDAVPAPVTYSTTTVAIDGHPFSVALDSLDSRPVPTPTHTTIGISPNAGVGVAVLLYAKVSPDVPYFGVIGFTAGYDLIPGCTARPVNATFGYATCVTTFTHAGDQRVSATYIGDGTHASSGEIAAVPVTDHPDLFQIALGQLIGFAHNLHVFGL